MSNFVPRLFRENEIKAKSFYACSCCSLFTLPPKLYAGVCENTITYDKSLTNIFLYCKSCMNEVDFVCNCPEKCEIKESEAILNAYKFYRVPCCNHKDRDSTSYTKKFTALCSECVDRTSSMEEIIELTYTSLSKHFFDLYSANYKPLSNDRRQKLVTYSCHEMLDACKWLYQLQNGLLCEEHTNDKAEFITDELKGLCRVCCHRNSRNRPLADISQATQSILEIIKSSENHKNPFYVNKYMTDMLKLNKNLSITTPIKLNLLILESRDLLNKVEYKTARCVACNVKLTEGWNKGIQLSCKHAACFNCIFTQNVSSCPIDNQDLEYMGFINTTQEHLMLCHVEHGLKPGENVYKLPCFHSSCEKHYEYGFCLQCGFSFDKWPNHQKHLSKLRTQIQCFYDIRCIVHDKPAKFMNILPVDFYCEDCVYQIKNGSKNIGIIDYLSIETCKHVIIKHIRVSMDILYLDIPESIKKYNFTNNLIKLFSYLSIKNFQSRFLAKTLLGIIKNCSGLISSKPILLYKQICTPHIWSRKKYFLDSKTSVIFNFKLNSDIILTGIIMSKFLMNYLDLRFAECSPISVKINYYNVDSTEIYETREIVNFSPYPNNIESIEIESLRKLLTICNFSHPIYLPASKMNYELIVELHSGYYLFSRPMSKLKHPFLEDLKIKRKLNATGLALNGSISSPVFGICAADVDSIISIQ